MLPLPPPMQRLHALLEHHDEFVREQRGFFLVEQDRATRDAPPVLIYIRPDHVHGPKSAARRPPDWICEFLPAAGAPSRLERYARAGVAEYWRVTVDPALAGGILLELCTEPDPASGVYLRLERVEPHTPLRSPTWEGLALRVADLI